MRKSANFQDAKVRRCKGSCRSRKMLQNEYLLAKIGFDTAENEPAKKLQNYIKIKELPILLILLDWLPRASIGGGAADPREEPAAQPAEQRPGPLAGLACLQASGNPHRGTQSPKARNSDG